MIPDRPRRGISLRAVAPNAVTALALCMGLSGVRFAVGGQWDLAVASIIVAGVLDGLDGRIARLLKGESRFGAELDSLSDVIAFGVSPALILYLWSLQALPRYGWLFALGHAVCCALRLARFNAQIDASEQPHKSAGFLTGVPAPAGAGLALLPIFIWLWSGEEHLRAVWIVAPWMALVAFLMISNVATYSWSSLRLRRTIRLEAIAGVALLGGALVTVPWETLTVVAVIYLALIPFSLRSYARVRQRRAAAARGAAPDLATPAP
ncbi:CDP-diacylglycerol O-phosphatidyltransferase [Sphingomonas sp. MAH-20]|jgi:CDP-diacylglycerol--serine O-phosphatidyltransferase|uniref:CDP-diacylglycerol O-phosphatidyltransferase n=1 Tax=Sphingomonas horti TaxID=2682842 RepID=A0A6I4J4U4_9SPHN|nr:MULTISPECIES: phosphatidylcholine/phosphatidylserine synthase [Sphingomonas]MBA2919330.1 phosphatidylcholine/phosphatidylserine synthase [Sphingomonas sp. CGMCC 1.13658]MVO78211.1 CDP-diacylglycerol O-phosphatidyltransferase [Sphingomonas horti]